MDEILLSLVQAELLTAQSYASVYALKGNKEREAAHLLVMEVLNRIKRSLKNDQK